MNTRKRLSRPVYREQVEGEGDDYSDSGSEAELPSEDEEEEEPDSAEEFSERAPARGRAKAGAGPKGRRGTFAKRFLSRLAGEGEEPPERQLDLRELTATDKLLPAVLQLSESDSSDDEGPPVKNVSAQKTTSNEASTSAAYKDPSDSESEIRTDYTHIWSNHLENSEEVAQKSFHHLQQQSSMFEQTKASIQRYSTKNNHKEVNVKDLLALGEEEIEQKKVERLEDSDSEAEDMEEVEEAKPLPKSGIQVVVEFPGGVAKKSKAIDVEMMMRRKINRVRKEYQIYMHKVHVLSWLGHGNYVSSVLNDQEVLAAALSLLPNKNCYPPERVDIDYVIKISKWYRDKIKVKLDRHEHKFRPKAPPLKEILLKQIEEYCVSTHKYLVYIFVSMLRALGLQCRVMINFVTVPIRPFKEDLCSLSTKNVKQENSVVKPEKNKSARKKPPVKTIKNTKKISQLDGQDDSFSSEMDYSDDDILQLDGNDDADVQKPIRGSRSLSLKAKQSNKTPVESVSDEDVSPPKRAKKITNSKNIDKNTDVSLENKRSRSRTPQAKFNETETTSKAVPKRNNRKVATSDTESTANNVTGSDNKTTKINTCKTNNEFGTKRVTKRNNRKISDSSNTNGSDDALEAKRSRTPTTRLVKTENTPESVVATRRTSRKTATKSVEQTIVSVNTRSRSVTPKSDVEQTKSTVELNINNNKKNTEQNTRNRSVTPKSDVSKSNESPLNTKVIADRNNTEKSMKNKSEIKETKRPRSRTQKHQEEDLKTNFLPSGSKQKEMVVIDKRNTTVTNCGINITPESSTEKTIKTTEINVIGDGGDAENLKINERKRRSPQTKSTNSSSKTNGEGKKGYCKEAVKATKNTKAQCKPVKVSSDFFHESESASSSGLKIPEILINNKKPDTGEIKNRLSLSRKRSRTSSSSVPKEKANKEEKKPEKQRTRSAPGNQVESSKYFEPSPDEKVAKSATRKRKVKEEDSLRVCHRDLLAKSPQKDKTLNVKKDLVKLIKERVNEAKSDTKKKLGKGKIKSESDDSDYLPQEGVRRESSDCDFKPRKITPKRPAKLDRRVLSTDDEKAKKRVGIDVWCEVYIEDLEQWISVDVVTPMVHCVSHIYGRASHPVSYIVGWDNNNRMKDLTRRYVPHWNTVTRKQRVDATWLNKAMAPWRGPDNVKDREENEQLDKIMYDAPLPKVISEYKDHPLYALKRHLLKFQALYPPDAPPLGFVRGEAVYARDCVYTCRSRDTWLKEAKTVKPGELPYKIVKARPKWDRLSNKAITDIPLEVFGEWQIQDFEPPTAENGVVPRNAYGNVELFKECMLPKGTVHIKLPNLNKVAKKLNIDCAPAMTGFDFHGGWTHPVYDGFVVCEEFEEIITDAWVKDQEEMAKREQEKIEARVYGNWKRLIKGLFIRERLQQKYAFEDPNAPAPAKKTAKGPRFVAKKKY